MVFKDNVTESCNAGCWEHKGFGASTRPRLHLVCLMLVVSSLTLCICYFSQLAKGTYRRKGLFWLTVQGCTVHHGREGMAAGAEGGHSR